jgi:hypothetical protein
MLDGPAARWNVPAYDASAAKQRKPEVTCAALSTVRCWRELDLPSERHRPPLFQSRASAIPE